MKSAISRFGPFIRLASRSGKWRPLPRVLEPGELARLLVDKGAICSPGKKVVAL